MALATGNHNAGMYGLRLLRSRAYTVTEQAPTFNDELRRVDGIVTRAREAVAAGLVVGSISVKYNADAWDTGQVWLRADCTECGAVRVMRASNEHDLGYLALSITRYGCAENGHDQTGQIEVVDNMPIAIGSMSLAELVEAEDHARERLSNAQDDLMILQDIRQQRFPVLPTQEA